MRFETVIGLEVHVELATRSKLFCSCATRFGAEPNTQVCPTCLGLPGALPTLNRRAVELAIRAGAALGCDIAEYSRFDRKNYFYPDLPKGYQITQQTHPLCTGGSIGIDGKRVGITRIHLEDDAGKLIHSGGETLVDCNRCGVPLIEIVSEPDIRSAAEAVAYLKKLRSILRCIGVSDCRMSEGSLRVDVNLSVRREDEPLGERTEIKNLSSFRSVERAIGFESARQIELVERGEYIKRETRRFDENSGRTFAMRRKETAADYRFFPEPNVAPFTVSAAEVARIRADLPELPDARRDRYISDYSLAPDAAALLASERAVAEWFDRAASLTGDAKLLANLAITELFRILPTDPTDVPISAEAAASIADMAADGRISAAVAKRLFERCALGEDDPKGIVEREGLARLTDRGELERLVREALADAPKLLADYRRGRLAARDAMLGAAMRRSGGRADPKILGGILDDVLRE